MSATRAIASAEASLNPLPFLDLKAQFASIRGELMAAVESVLESQQFILGKEVEQLEREIAAYVGDSEAVGCASGSDALFLSLLALHIGRGDEVITTPFTFVATAGAIARIGAKPVFVDIDPATFNLDPAEVSAAVTSRTRAIMPVHLFGQTAELGRIMAIAQEKGLLVVEDAAQAVGATYDEEYVGNTGHFG